MTGLKIEYGKGSPPALLRSYGVAREVKKKKMDDKVIKLVAFLLVVFACVWAWVATTTLSAIPVIDAGGFGLLSPMTVAALTIVVIWFWGVCATLTDGKYPILYAVIIWVFLAINHCVVNALPALEGWVFWMLFVLVPVTLFGVSEIVD